MSDYVTTFTSSPLFGIALTFGLYGMANMLYTRQRSQLFNPLLLSAIAIMFILVRTHIPVESYLQGASLITFWLGPAAVALAVPLYRQVRAWRSYLPALLCASCVGSLVGLVIAPLVAWLLGTEASLVRALAPRSVTTPIAVELAKTLGAVPEVTAALVIVTGVLGHMFAPQLLTAIRVNHPVARGLAVGVAAHGIGTARMLKESEKEGAASGMGMSLAGLITGVLVGVYATLVLSK